MSGVELMQEYGPNGLYVFYAHDGCEELKMQAATMPREP